MFGTWKYDPETQEVQNLRQAFDPITARSSQHQACNRCHEKKLRCSGDKDGCDRCIANRLECDYSRSSSRGSGRRNVKTRRRSAEDTGKDSPVRSRTTSSTSQKRSSASHSQRLSPSQGHTDSPLSSSSTLPPHSAYGGSQRDALEELDIMWAGEEAFDIRSITHSVDDLRAMMTCAPTSGSYLAPVTDSPIAYHPPYGQDYHGYYQQNHGFEHATASSMAYPNMVTAGQGYAGDHEDDYMHYQNQQPAYQHSYWDSGQRGGRR